jgi:hypothetical protein
MTRTQPRWPRSCALLMKTSFSKHERSRPKVFPTAFVLVMLGDYWYLCGLVMPLEMEAA